MHTCLANTGNPSSLISAGVPHPAVGDERSDTAGHARIGEDVTELAGRLVAGGHDQHVARLRVADRDLEHDVVARMADNRECRPAERHVPVDGLDTRIECTLSALGFVDGGGREGAEFVDHGLVGAVDLGSDVNHGDSASAGAISSAMRRPSATSAAAVRRTSSDVANETRKYEGAVGGALDGGHRRVVEEEEHHVLIVLEQRAVGSPLAHEARRIRRTGRTRPAAAPVPNPRYGRTIRR